MGWIITYIVPNMSAMVGSYTPRCIVSNLKNKIKKASHLSLECSPLKVLRVKHSQWGYGLGMIISIKH